MKYHITPNQGEPPSPRHFQTRAKKLLPLLIGLALNGTPYLSIADIVPSPDPLFAYDDALVNGFVTYEWKDGANDCILNPANTSNKASGTSSIELNLNHYCTVIFFQDGQWNAGTYIGGFDVSAYSYLEFDLYAEAPAQATFGISLTPKQEHWSTIGSQVLIGNYIAPVGQWQHVKIPMKDFNLMAGTLVEGIRLRNDDQPTNNIVYGHVLIDNISFTPNLDPPAVTSASSADLVNIKVVFNKPLAPATATNTANYTIASTQDGAYSTPLAPQSVSISPDKTSVTLKVPARLKANASYQLVLNNIADQFAIPHVIAANTLANFTATYNPVTINIDANSNKHSISPYIYGLVTYGKSSAETNTLLADLNFKVNREGGNRATTYNWLENATNHAFDWFYESMPDENGGATPGGMIDAMVHDSRNNGVDSIVTIPTIGWVAKLGPNRSILASYSQSKYGAQKPHPWYGGYDDWFPDAGTGVLSSTGENITWNDPNDAYVPSDVDFQAGFVNHLVSQWGPAQSGGVKFYAMDNEPGIWSGTHMDIHPVGPTMEEIRDKILSYGAMVKQQDPNAQVLGPEEDGWTRFLVSGYDSDWGSTHGWDMASLPDRLAHGGMEYIPWLLDQLHQNNQATGKRVLDMLSLHWYPQSGEYSSDISPNTMLLRNRSTRTLWDANYTDESWIATPVQLIPRMKQWVNQYYPGTKVGITEYNWGAETNINGATALADVLGIFGREGLDMATYWTVPAANTPTYQAMRLYRNYDGAKSTFGDTSVSDVVPNPDNISSFAALRSGDGALTIMVINKQLETDSAVTFNVSHFSGAGSAKAYQLTSEGTINNLGDYAYQNGALDAYLPAQSVTLFVIPPGAAALPSSQASVTSSGLVYSRVTQTFNGTVTLKNIGASPLTGPFQLVFTGLTSGVSLANPTGSYAGSSYLTVPGVTSLVPGQSATVAVKFNDPTKVAIHFSPVVYTGSLN